MSESTARRSRERFFAHTDGGVPNILLDVDKMDEYNSAGSSTSRRHAEFPAMSSESIRSTSPALKAGKLNMFALMGKPGYEERRAELEKTE